ncbi:MAG: hypothetical protein E4G94_12120 [ANME-2 cluster archaeon]|nr:MAG: hypothetical protein E4G94_12120 [ANME-2 cluster archaeon]
MGQITVNKEIRIIFPGLVWTLTILTLMRLSGWSDVMGRVEWPWAVVLLSSRWMKVNEKLTWLHVWT